MLRISRKEIFHYHEHTMLLSSLVWMHGLIQHASLVWRKGDIHVIRNAGGQAADALRSLIISEHYLARAPSLFCIIQTMACSRLQTIHEKVKNDLSVDADYIAFLSYKNLEQSVRDDIAFLRISLLIPQSIDIRGFIYNVKTRKLQSVN